MTKSGRPQYRLNKRTSRRARILGRYRSLSERRVADELKLKGIKFKYENTKFEYFLRGRSKMLCPNCGPVSGMVRKQYLPDFELPNGVFIEVKGRLTSKDRTKLATVKQQHPGINLCLLFDANRFVEGQRAGKPNKIRYGDWANKTGIPWAVKDIPDEWLAYTDNLDFPKDIKYPRTISVPEEIKP